MNGVTGSIRVRTLVMCLTVVVTVVFAQPAMAVVINVPADQPTIQAAVNAAAPGDEIVVGNGTWAESVDLGTMGTPGNLTIRAATPLGATVDGSVGPAFFSAGFTGNLTFQDFNLDQNPGNTGGIIDLIDMDGVLLVENCDFISGFGGNGVRVETTAATQTNVEIRNSLFDSPADNLDAISVELFGSTNVVDLTVVENEFRVLEDDGISFRANSTATGGEMRATITGNQFSLRDGSGDDIELFFGNNTTGGFVASATVQNNTLVGPGYTSGISGEAIVVDVDGAATVATVNISGNTISEYADDGIFVDSDSTAQGTLLDLVIDNNTLTNIEDSGILVRPFDGNLGNTTIWNVTVTNNTVSDANRGGSLNNAGIEFDVNSSQDDYIANIILNNNLVTSGPNPAYLFDQANASTVNLDQNLSASTDPFTVVTDNLNTGVPVEIRGTVNVVVITPQIRVDIDVSTTESIDPVIAGSGPGNLVYVVTVINDGPDGATGVELSEVLTLPAGVTIDSITPSGTTSFTSPTWTIGTLAASASETLTIVLTVDPTAASGVDVISSTATVTAVNETDTDAGNDSSTESTSVSREVDIQLAKVESIDPVAAGSGLGNLTYVVTVTNLGPSDASGVVVAEALTLPAGVSVDSITPSVGGYVDPTWTIGNLPASASATLTVVLTVGASTAAGTDVISDTAAVVSVNEIDTNPANDAATESTSVTREVDLSVTKAESTDPVVAGSGPGNLTYVVTVTNNGPSDASGVVVTETLTLPAGVAVDSVTPSAGVFTEPTWTLGALANGASETLTVVLTVSAVAAAGTDVVGNTATITAVNETDTNAANDSATESTSISGEADLSITKSDDQDPVTAGTSLVYTLTVTNNGPTDAAGVTVTDTLPPGVTLVSTAGCAEDPTGAPTCSLGTIAAGGSTAFTVTVDVDPETVGTLMNTASVTSTTSDPNPANDTATENTTVEAVADLALAKTGGPDPVLAGENLVYTLTVTNNGPSAAADVVVTDTLAPGVNLISTTGCAEDPAGAPTCSLGTLAPSASAQYTITVGVDPATRGTLLNTADVTSTAGDPNPADNMASESTTVEAQVDLVLTKEAAPEPVPVGEDLVYTLTVTNQGPSQATNVVVTDTLPAAVTLVSTVGCAEDPAGTPTCSLGSLAPGSWAQYSITVSIDPSPPPTLINSASAVSTEPEANPADNTDQVTTTLDLEPPTVTAIDTVPGTSDGSLEDCDEVRHRITALVVSFSEAMFDPTGDSDPDDVTNPANYMVIGAGPDGDFSTDTCGPVFGDDLPVAVLGVTYDDPTTTAELLIGGLPSSQIRFLACGSTTLVDVAGNPLDGTGSGVGGDDLVVTFRSDARNLLTNAHFDCDAVGLNGWTVSDPVEITRSNDDIDGSPISGSAQVMQLGVNTIFELGQCVPTTFGMTYDFSGTLRMDTPSFLSFTRGCEFFAGSSCGSPGSGLATKVNIDLLGDTGGVWIPLMGTMEAPVGAESAYCTLTFTASSGQDFSANLDDLILRPGALMFTDGFESGDVSAWSASVP
jgi:uncharacterized repeat protein (TIGR01451 family)